MAHALGAFVRIDLVNLDAHEDRVVRALGLAHVAIDAFIGNDQGHRLNYRPARLGWPYGARKSCS